MPVRVGRMVASPYGFLRGTAVVMAEDVAHLPATGITPVVCGDSHLGNFGFYASPERDLVIDLNDFDEAHPGGWEWDLRRLVASIWVAGPAERRERGRTARPRCAPCVARLPRARSGYLADQPLMSRSFERLDVDRAGRRRPSGTAAGGDRAAAAKRARQRTSDRALPRFTEEVDGRRRIVEEPPLITRRARRARPSCSPPRSTSTCSRSRRTGGGSSAATRSSTSRTRSSASAASGCAPTSRCWRARTPDDVVFLQLKQARRSVLARYVHGESAWHAHQGQRVVEYQQALQTVSDPLLGWTSVDGRQYYVRQFRNMKGTHRRSTRSTPPALADYAGVVGAPARQGPRPHQRRVDDRRLRRRRRTSSTWRWPVRPARTPTRPRPTTPRSSTPSSGACCRWSTGCDQARRVIRRAAAAARSRRRAA